MRVNRFYQCPDSQISEQFKCPSFQARLMCKGPFNRFGLDIFSKSKRLILKELSHPIEQKVPGSESLTSRKIFGAFRTAFENRTQKLPGIVVLKQSTVFPNSLSLDYIVNGRTFKGLDSKKCAPKDPFPASTLIPYFDDGGVIDFDRSIDGLTSVVQDLVNENLKTTH